jgi:hypothetical protein
MKVTQLHQIELTSRCNLRCKYCAHATMQRPKQDMPVEIFEAALYMVKHFAAKGSQHELNLAGIGESTIHKNFGEFVRMARVMLPRIDLTMATNGLTMSSELAEVLAVNRVRTWVSLHRPEKAGLAIDILRRYNILAGTSSDPSVAGIDWGGQIEWPVSAPSMRCMWQDAGMAVVFSDGRIGSCSMDGQGKDGVIGTVSDDPESLEVRPYSLCESCHQTIGGA